MQGKEMSSNKVESYRIQVNVWVLAIALRPSPGRDKEGNYGWDGSFWGEYEEILLEFFGVRCKGRVLLLRKGFLMIYRLMLLLIISSFA
jgi:hypothetical protein